MPMSDKTRRGVGIEPKGIDPASALGVVSSIIKSERQDLSKAEQMMEVASKALTVEDDPWNLLPNERKSQIIAPTYDPVVLSTLPLQNNVLSQLIEAMEVNIDGTGHDFERRDGEAKTDQEKKEDIGYLFDFFDNVFPGQSFVSLRRSIRRDRETTGNGYLEVIRDGEGKITLLNRLDAKLTRMVRLDDPVMTEKTIVRDGKEAKVKMFVRERRYAQIVGTKVIYFREFGSSRHLNALTGEWLDEAPKVKPHVAPGESTRDAKGKGTDKDADKEDDAEGEPKKKANPFAKADAPKAKTDKNGNPLEYATEVIHFGLKSDVVTNYGVPRWVSQIPSILGSREAEELNLEYFRHGGLPPVMIMIQGGQLSQQSRTDLNGYLSGSAKSKTRAVIAEIFSTSGDLGSAGNVKATVERFGGDRQADCHDDQTEVLTPEGWVGFPALREGVPVATLNPETGGMEYHVPERYVVQDYQGPMVALDGTSANFRVTPNHDLWGRTRHGDYHKFKAGAWESGYRWLTTAARASAATLATVSVPKYLRRVADPEGYFAIPADDFLYFLGLYVGDGCVSFSNYQVRLGARSETKCRAFAQALGQVALAIEQPSVRTYSLKGGGQSIELASKSLSLWLRENIGLGAKNKRLPEWCLSLSATQSEVLLRGLFESDGTQCPDRAAWVYRTSSRTLADQVQILALRTGARATLRQEGDDFWRVNIVPDTAECVHSTPVVEQYAGKIYCVEVKNHLVFTRRCGSVVVSGNSMFEGYDTKCAERVRSSFRLPPMFVGYAQDYSYATATASYLVAESQVFKPERELFDEAINATIMRELAPDYYFRSLPMTIHDVNVQLTALGLVKDLSDKEEFVDEVNELAGLNLTYEEPPAPQPGMDQFGNPMDPFADKDEAGGFPPKGAQPKQPAAIPAEFLKADVTPVSLAADWADFLSGERQFSPESVRVMKSTIDALPPPTRELFSAYVGMRLAPAATRDPDGVAELLSCAGECLHGKH